MLWGLGDGPWPPEVGWGSPCGTCEVRMGLGQGLKKAVGGNGLGQSQVEMVRVGLPLLGRGAGAGEGAG